MPTGTPLHLDHGAQKWVDFVARQIDIIKAPTSSQSVRHCFGPRVGPLKQGDQILHEPAEVLMITIGVASIVTIVFQALSIGRETRKPSHSLASPRVSGINSEQRA